MLGRAAVVSLSTAGLLSRVLSSGAQLATRGIDNDGGRIRRGTTSQQPPPEPRAESAVGRIRRAMSSPLSTSPTREDVVIQRWSGTEPDDGGHKEGTELLNGVGWDGLVPTGKRGRLDQPLRGVIDPAAPAPAPKAVGTGKKGKKGKKAKPSPKPKKAAGPTLSAATKKDFTESIANIAAGKAPEDEFLGAFMSSNPELSGVEATALRDDIDTVIRKVGSEVAAEEAAEAAESAAAAKKLKSEATQAAMQAKTAQILEDQAAAKVEAEDDIIAVHQLLAADPILKKIRLKPQENRNMSAGEATQAQADAAVAAWRRIGDQQQLTNFHVPGGHGGFVSKWRPPVVEVNVVLKCIIFGGKEIIIHISPDKALNARMVAHHNNDYSVNNKVRQYIPAYESE